MFSTRISAFQKSKPTVAPAVSKLDVYFERQTTVYDAGELICGQVELDLKQEQRIKGIKIHFHGAARVSWDEKRSITKGSAPVVSMKSSEVFLNHNIYLLRNDGTYKHGTKRKVKMGCFPIVREKDTEAIMIPSGVHKFPFEFTLPKYLPSSYDGKWGRIQYSVRVTLERLWKSDIDHVSSFGVRGVVDFNEDPEIVRPVAVTRHMSAGCCVAGYVKVYVRVAKKGFLCGESIPYYVEIANNSWRRIRECKIALVQHAIFNAGSDQKRTSVTLKSTQKGEIQPGETIVWENDNFCIPEDLPPSCQKEGCKAIQIKYSLSVILTRSSWRGDYSIPLNLIIGTRALTRETLRNYISSMGVSRTESESSSTLQTLLQSGSDYSDTKESHRMCRYNTSRSSLASRDQSASRRMSLSSINETPPPPYESRKISTSSLLGQFVRRHKRNQSS